MAGEKNFVVKNGISIGTTEVISSSGKIAAAALSSNTDFTEQVQDIVGAFITGTGSTTVTYNDAGDALTISSTGKTEEEIQDIIGAAIATNGSHTGVSVSYDDAGDGAIDITVSLSSFSTSDLSEGSNQYHTTERVQDVVGAQLVTNGSHTNITASYDDANDGAIDLSISDATIRGKISASGDLSYNNTTGVISYTEPTMYADSDARGAISVTDSGGDGSLAYDSSTGVITYTGPSASETRAHFSAGTGVTITNGAVAIGQAVGTSDTPSFAGVTLTGASTVSGHILPSADVTYDLGSSSYQWRDIYVGPGSLYVNGQKVLEDSSGTIIVSADSDQNLQMKTAGSGDIEFNPSGTGVIQAKGTLQMLDGKLITNSAGNNVAFGNNISVDQIASRSADTNLVLSGNGTGNVTLNDDVVISGSLTVSGTTTTVNSETINLADNILNLNSDFTSGSPTQDAGLSVSRGGSAAKTFLWDETNDRWTVGSDNMVAGTFIGALSGNATTASAWETARTLSLTGAVTGSASVDGSGNVSLTTTATSDPTLTLAGDASGSATFTNLGNATLTVTVANDSHTHTVSTISDLTATAAELNIMDGITATTAELNYMDGVTSNVQTQLNAKLASSSYTAADVLTKIKTVDGAGSGLDADLLDGQSSAYYQPASSALTTSTTFGGDVSGTYNAIVVADDSHNHIIGNVDGLQAALDAKYGSGSNATLGTITTSNASNAGGYVRNIFQSTSTPGSGDGAVGDLWIYYS